MKIKIGKEVKKNKIQKKKFYYNTESCKDQTLYYSNNIAEITTLKMEKDENSECA